MNTTCRIPIPPLLPVVCLAPPAQLVYHQHNEANNPQLNWSHFKQEFADKPDEDAEAHLLRTNDWMDTPVFEKGIKVQRFCIK